jgi:hypothetical protein
VRDLSTLRSDTDLLRRGDKLMANPLVQGKKRSPSISISPSMINLAAFQSPSDLYSFVPIVISHLRLEDILQSLDSIESVLCLLELPG